MAQTSDTELSPERLHQAYRDFQPRLKKLHEKRPSTTDLGKFLEDAGIPVQRHEDLLLAELRSGESPLTVIRPFASESDRRNLIPALDLLLFFKHLNVDVDLGVLFAPSNMPDLLARVPQAWRQRFRSFIILDSNSAVQPGFVAVRKGEIFPATAELEFLLKQDQKAKNPADLLHISSHIVTSVKQLIWRRIDPLLPAKVTFGAISQPAEPDVENQTLKMKATLATLSEKGLAKLPALFQTELEGLAKAMGAHLKIETLASHPAIHNNNEIICDYLAACETTIGRDRVLPLEFLNREFFELSYDLPLPSAAIHISALPSVAAVSDSSVATILESAITPLAWFLSKNSR